MELQTHSSSKSPPPTLLSGAEGLQRWRQRWKQQQQQQQRMWRRDLNKRFAALLASL